MNADSLQSSEISSVTLEDNHIQRAHKEQTPILTKGNSRLRPRHAGIRANCHLMNFAVV